MRRLFPTTYIAIRNFAYLTSSGHSGRNKFRILCAWLRINFKYLTYATWFKFNTEKIFGLHFKAFEYKNIKFLYEDIFYRNEYYFSTKNDRPVIFDCGANIGMATLFFKWLYPNSSIYSFEPDPATFELLKYNVEKNKLKDVYLFNWAISDHDGKIDFYVDKKTPGSLVMSTKKERMTEHQQFSSDKIEVSCVSFANFISNQKLSKIDYLKMDIEGAENEVLQDLEQAGQVGMVEKYGIEYHHNINEDKSKLSSFLQIFEKANYSYQVDAKCIPLSAENKYQDLHMSFYNM